MVSVILPTRNRDSYLPESINSVLSQNFKYLELIIIDDNSSDKTEQVVSDFLKKDGRIKYIKNKNKSNLQKLLNIGLNASSGEYIARIDDDDLWIVNDKIGKQVDFLEKNKDYLLIGTNGIMIDEDGKKIGDFFNPPKNSDIRNSGLFRNCFASSGVVFRKKEAVDSGYFDENVQLSGDYEMWLRLGTIGKFGNLPSQMIALRYFDKDISKKRLTRIIDALKIIKKYKNYYPFYHRALLINYFKIFYLFLPRIGFLDRWLFKKRQKSFWRL